MLFLSFTLYIYCSVTLCPLSEVRIFQKKTWVVHQINFSFTVRSCRIYKFAQVHYLGFHFPESL